jgi:CBS domain-containing protein
MKPAFGGAAVVVIATPHGSLAAFSRAQLGEAKFEEGFTYPHVHRDQPLEEALERMEEAEVGAIAVVDRADVRRVLGAALLDDVRAAFRNPHARG